MVGVFTAITGARAEDSLRAPLPLDTLGAWAESTFVLSDSLSPGLSLTDAWLYPLGIVVLTVGAVIALFTIRSK